MTSFREYLRSLPVFPDGLPGWDVDDLDALPTAPEELFERWLAETVDAGTFAPHAMTVSTADGQGRVDARTVILQDIADDGGWWFAGHAASPKGHDLAANPHAALTFLWRETARQVRVTGPVSAHEDVGADDFRARSDASRAAGLVGHQSEVLGGQADHRAAWADALARVRAEPQLVAPGWTAWRLDPAEVQFWQTGTGTGQTRVRYRSDPSGWVKDLLWP